MCSCGGGCRGEGVDDLEGEEQDLIDDGEFDRKPVEMLQTGDI